MMTRPVANCVFCEQIREEASGNLIFIGVISGKLFIERPREERELALTQFIQIRGIEPGPYDFTLTIEKDVGGKETISATLRGHLEVGEGDLEAMIIAEGLKVPIAEECTIKAFIKLGDLEPMGIGAFRVSFFPEGDDFNDN